MHTGTPSLSIPSAQNPFLDQVDGQNPQLYSFNTDNFGIGPSRSQEKEPELIQQTQAQIRVGTPPLPPPVAMPRASTQGNSLNSVLTMPIPGTKLAPEKFRGDFHKVKDFIQHYERLCIQNNVTLDNEKCETLLRYCSKRERQTIKNVPSYNVQNWSRLRSDILRLYDADLDTKRYKVKDVRIFSKRQKAKRIKDLAAWKKYCRKFLRIAGSLLNGAKISPKEHATYFWQGIPKPLKIRIENRILTRNPVRDLSEPFSIFEIDTAAEAILQRDRFDTALDDSDSDDERSSGEELTSEDSDEETSDSDSEDERLRKRTRKKGKSLRKKSSDENDNGLGKSETSRKRTVKGNRREVEGLIKQMNLLTQDDPKYGLAYYRAMKLDTDVSKIVSEPIRRQEYVPMQPWMNASTFQQSVQPFVAPRNPVPPMPANFPPRNIVPNRPVVPNLSAPRGSEIICYGCGEKGHGMMSCVIINDLISKGLLTKDGAGRIVNKDGTTIRRLNGETFVQAFEREQRPQAHLITIPDTVEYYESDKESDDEEAEDFVYAIRGSDFDTFGAERPAKQITTKRKMVMDGVYPPRVKDLKSSKENEPAKDPETGRTIRMTKNQPSPVGIPREIKKKERHGDPILVDVHEPRFNGQRDEQIIEDAVPPRQKGNPVKKDHPNVAAEEKSVEKKVPRKSAVSAHVNPFKVLDHVLNTKVELAVGEIIGVSRELSTLLADSIKIKSQVSAPVGLATSFRTKTRGLLIKLSMECDGIPIQAIIDTGSQLNIVSETACNGKIRRPIDRKTSVSMNDANGGEGNLNGIVENVPLNCGGVMTQANLYVGAHVPFDLLLGRPWQRGNYVSIDERRDGTYLLFKDPKDLEARYEVLVTPDAMNPVEWDFDPSTWLTYEPPTSFFINADKEIRDDEDQTESLVTDIPNLEKNHNLSFSHTHKNNENMTALHKVLTDELLRYTSELLPKQESSKSIKELESNDKKQAIFTPAVLQPNMAIQLSPARVQHDVELPSLFTTPVAVRTEAERLLMGQGDLTHFGNNHHIRHIIASSGSGVIVGHLPDQHGNQRTDVMLFNMGLITSLAPNAPNSSIPLDPSPGVDIQHGLGILHFYPNLGSEAPSDWQLPVFVPPVQAAVSLDQWPDRGKFTYYTSQVPSDSAVVSPFPIVESDSTVEFLRTRSRPFGFATDRDSDFEFSSDTTSSASSDDEAVPSNETAFPCTRCLSSHFDPCPLSSS